MIPINESTISRDIEPLIESRSSEPEELDCDIIHPFIKKLAQRVYNILGVGHSEYIYHRALEIELRNHNFALETENEIVNAKNKLEKKQLDAIILNSISDENTCFNSDKNKIHFITKSKTKKFKLKFKNEVAKDILHEIYNL